VLPDAASGQGPDTLAGKLSQCKEGMAHFLPSGYKFGRSQKNVKVQDLDCVQVRVSGCKMLNEFIWPAEQGMMINDQKKKERSGP